VLRSRTGADSTETWQVVEVLQARTAPAGCGVRLRVLHGSTRFNRAGWVDSLDSDGRRCLERVAGHQVRLS
jgi:hypothetical protein